MNGARARPYMWASRSRSAADTPVISATRAGAKRGSTSRSSRSKPERLPREIVAVAEAVAREHVHEAERERGVACRR